MKTQNITQETQEVCSVWQEQSKIPYSIYSAKTDSTGSEEFFEFVSNLEKQLQDVEGSVVINGGHYIPFDSSSDYLPKNAKQTWNQACYIAKRLQGNGIDAKVSLLINDLPLSHEERAKLDYSVPRAFQNVAENYGVEIMTSAANKGCAHSEKKGANRFSRYEERATWNIYPQKVTSYCIGAIIDYLRDIKSQGATESVWVTPKCSSKNMLDALRMYTKYEGGVGNQCYFDTPNCFK
jgi:hypothetical protein